MLIPSLEHVATIRRHGDILASLSDDDVDDAGASDDDLLASAGDSTLA